MDINCVTFVQLQFQLSEIKYIVIRAIIIFAFFHENLLPRLPFAEIAFFVCGKASPFAFVRIFIWCFSESGERSSVCLRKIYICETWYCKNLKFKHLLFADVPFENIKFFRHKRPHLARLSLHTYYATFYLDNKIIMSRVFKLRYFIKRTQRV